MEQINSVTVVGRGAIGAVYCEALARTQNIDFRVAVDPVRYDRYREQKFVLNGHQLDLNYFVPSGSVPKADLVIIATKWSGYADALNIVDPIVGERTIVLPLLNGLLPYEIAEKRYGKHRAMMGYYVGHTASRDGNAVHQDGAYRTVIGEQINKQDDYSDRLKQVVDLFDRAGVRYRVDEDMEYSRWLKFVINLGLNQTSAIDSGLNYGQIRASNHYRELCSDLMNEGVAVAKMMGVRDAETIAVEAARLLDTLPDEDYSSMAQDVRAGRSIEWEIFGGHLLSLAQKLKLELPIHQRIEKLLKQIAL